MREERGREGGRTVLESEVSTERFLALILYASYMLVLLIGLLVRDKRPQEMIIGFSTGFSNSYLNQFREFIY